MTQYCNFEILGINTFFFYEFAKEFSFTGHVNQLFYKTGMKVGRQSTKMLTLQTFHLSHLTLLIMWSLISVEFRQCWLHVFFFSYWHVKKYVDSYFNAAMQFTATN